MASKKFQEIKRLAFSSNPDAQFYLARYYYKYHDYENAEYWLHLVRTNPKADRSTKKIAFNLANSSPINALHSGSRVPSYSAVRITRGGNTPQGIYGLCTGRQH